MHCPFCQHPETKVTDSRLAGDGGQIRRRRECLECCERFTTYEVAEINMPRVVKRDGRREPFNDEKLRRGMMHSLEKRPVKTEDIESSINRIKSKLKSSGEKEIPAKTIGDWVMSELHMLDHVAYIRFASVYLSFESINAFSETIEKLETELPEAMRRDQLPLIDLE